MQIVNGKKLFQGRKDCFCFEGDSPGLQTHPVDQRKRWWLNEIVKGKIETEKEHGYSSTELTWLNDISPETNINCGGLSAWESGRWLTALLFQLQLVAACDTRLRIPIFTFLRSWSCLSERFIYSN